MRWLAGVRLPLLNGRDALKGLTGCTDQMCWFAITKDGVTHSLHLPPSQRKNSKANV